jgi:hypothetical protein
LNAAYGRDIDPDTLALGLAVVAKALNVGDLGKAMVAAVRLRLPDLDPAGAERLTSADETLAKAYNEQEPRDWRGRWTTGGTGRPIPQPPRRELFPAPVANNPLPPVSSAKNPIEVKPFDPAAEPCAPGAPPTGVPPREAVFAAFKRLYSNFQSQFDNLGPVEFAKRVTNFGEWIETQAHDNRPFDRTDAKAEYYFLQNRLSFWLGYQYKSFGAYLNLISASETLFQGATNSGLVRQGDPDGLPWSMVDVASLAALLDEANSGRGGFREPKLPETSEFAPTMAERAGVGATAMENAQAGIGWGRGIQDQGTPWELHLKEGMPTGTQYFPRAKTWDFANPATGKVISAKTLDTTTYPYAAYPERVFTRLKGYIDDAASYELATTRVGARIPLDQISSREIQLAVPETTSPAQWDRIIRAQRYSESRGVGFVVTRIR